MNKLFDDSVDTDRFSIAPVNLAISSNPKYSVFKTQLEEHFTPQVSKKILQALIRFSFYIEPVKQPKIETTKFAVRWSPSLDYDQR